MSPSTLPDGRPMSFKRLMALKPTGTDIFTSLTPAWPPSGVAGRSRAFGGHVYAQAAYAASKTVAKGMIIHNITGHFLLPGRIDTPFTYHVRRVRDGGVYCLRSVDVYQEVETAPGTSNARTDGTPCFVGTVSFKREERDSGYSIPFQHQNAPSDHLQRTYASVLAGREISSHPLSPAMDAVWWIEQDRDREQWKKAAEMFPGLEIRKVEMEDYNGPADQDDHSKAGEWRQLCFYRLILGDDDDDDAEGPTKANGAVVDAAAEAESDLLNLDACAHLYASDRNSLFLVQRALGFNDRVVNMASLSHTVVFHGSPQRLRLRDAGGRPKWFVQEACTSNSGENRGCHESRLWDWDEGRIVGTSVQDGMVRVPPTRPRL